MDAWQNIEFSRCPKENECTIEREFFIDNILAQIHLITKMTLVDRPCAMGV